MPGSPYTVIARGRDALGTRWEVAVHDGGLVVDMGTAPVVVADIAGTLATAPVTLCLDGEQRDRFAEAVARATVPGQVSG